MKKTTFIAIITTFLLLNLSLLFSGVIADDMDDSLTIDTNSDTNFNFDGRITAGEWGDHNFVGKYFMDVENGDGDADWYNYLYMGRDESNLYVGYDFISDQTDNPTGEWIGLWFNTQESMFNTTQEWHDILDDSTESILYDVDNNHVFPYFTDSGPSPGLGAHVNDDTEISIQYGIKNMSANYTDLDDHGINDYEVNSTLVNSNYTYWIEFSIDMVKWYPMFPEIYLNNISSIDLRIDTFLNTTIEEHKIVLWYPNGSIPDFNDPNQAVNISRDAGDQQSEFNIGVGNVTTNHKLQFTLFGNHSAGFQNKIDFLRFGPLTHDQSTPSCVDYPYSSINAFEIKWSFSSSPNNNSNHRMFEFIIPLNELNNYDGTGTLGVFIAGYGTCGFVNTDYWCIPTPVGDPQVYEGYYNSSRYLYITVNAIEPSDDGIDPLIIILAIVIPGSIGGVMIGLGFYFKKHPDKLKKLSKKLR